MKLTKLLLLALLFLLGTAAPAMATDYYVKSGAAGAADGTTWTDAFVTVAACLAATTPTRCFVSDNHAETQATALTWTSPGTSAAPVQILCVDDAATPPTALATTCTVTTTAASAMSFTGHAYVYGTALSAGNSTGTANINFISTSSWWWAFENSSLALGTTGAASASRMLIGSNGTSDKDGALILINSTLTFAGLAQAINPSGIIRMTGGSVTGTAPTSLFKNLNGRTPDVLLNAVDLSGFGSGKFILDVSGTSARGGLIEVRNSKLASGVALVTSAHAGPGGTVVRLTNADNTDTNYRYASSQYEGDVVSETGVVRTGGASNGTTQLSWKMTSSAGATFTHPLVSPEIILWNETTGSAQTITVHITHDSGSPAPLTDGDVWLTCGHPGTSGFPLAVVLSDRKTDILTTPVDQTTSTATWTGTGGFTTVNKQQLSVTMTSTGKGLRGCRINLGKASQTIYADPKLVVE